MDLQWLYTFREVARTLNLTKSAERMGYAQSSVTAHIQKLEQSYGTPLFERYGRGIRLTAAGETLYTHTLRIIQELEESKDRVAEQAGGSLSVGTIETLAAYFLPPVLNRFRELQPYTRVTLKPGLEPAIIRWVKEGELDGGLILDLPFTDPELHTIRIREEEMVLVADKTHPLADGLPLGPEALAGQSFVLTENGCSYRAALEGLLQERQIPYVSAFELSSLEAVKQCVSYGLGLAWMPRISAAEDLAEGRLREIPFRHPDKTFYTQWICHRKKWLSPSMEKFIELLHTAAASS